MERSALLKTSKSEASPNVGEDAKTVLTAETINPAQEVKASSNDDGPPKEAVSREG